MEILKVNKTKVVDLRDEDTKFASITSLIDYLGITSIKGNSDVFIIDSKSLSKPNIGSDTEYMEQLLTKCKDYNLRLVVVDLDMELNQCAEDYIYSLNNGKHLFLVSNLESGISLLKGVVK